MSQPLTLDDARRLPHRTAPQPLLFPEEQKVSESENHLKARTFLYQLIDHLFGTRGTVCSEQFVYFDASDPARRLSPDVLFKWGSHPELPPVRSWKIWERGVPELCVEVDSPGDESGWPVRFARYRALGVRELVRFDADAPEGERLRVWDRIEEDLVERTVDRDMTPCLTLGLHWVVVPGEWRGLALRLAEDPEGTRIVPDRVESEQRARAAAEDARVAAEDARVAAEDARVAAEDARVAAERTLADERQSRHVAELRVAELEAALKARG